MDDTSTALGLTPWLENPRPHPRPTPYPHLSPPQSLWQAYQLAEQWCWDRWKELEGGPPPPHRRTNPDPGGGTWKPDTMPHKKAVLRLHTGLPNAHTSILTQIRTGKIGLAAFLHKCRVPGFPSLACPCGWQWETAKHVILDCPRFSRERQVFRHSTSTTDFKQLTSDHQPAAALAVWFLHLDLLPQFSWARDQLSLLA